MPTAKITLSASRDIPFNKLVLSQSNVRRVKAGVSIEELAEDIARRSLLQSLNVRPVLDADGQETGMFEVPAGGRRFRTLDLLVKQKRMNKSDVSRSRPPARSLRCDRRACPSHLSRGTARRLGGRFLAPAPHVGIRPGPRVTNCDEGQWAKDSEER
jgi:ParB/Sulfiredoxin domain